MSTASIYKEIIEKVKRLYDGYDERANQMAEDKREKMGTKIDKQENNFISKLTLQQKSMAELLEEMKKYQKGAVNQYKQNMNLIKDCLADIRTILKKKSLNFKINQYIRGLLQDTDTHLISLRKDLATYGETKFCCCGTDGAKRFKTPMNLFKIVAGKWKMVTNFQSKDSIENFVSPKFNEPEYAFIEQILRKRWPQSKVIQVQKEVVKEVVKYVGDKPSILQRANEFIFGINRQQNLAYGLQIYTDQADKNSNPIACTFLGKVYEDGVFLGKDLKKAVTYYQKGMANKEPFASYRFAMLLIKGLLNRNGQTKEDIEKGFNILNQITTGDNPSPQALCQLGEIYEFGSFQEDRKQLFQIKKDLNKAVMYYNKARNLHLPRASNNLGVLYLQNKQFASTDKNDTMPGDYQRKVMGYLTESQISGFGQAYYNLGVIYSKGLLGQKNSDLALNMFYEGSLKNDYKSKIKFAYELMNQTSIMKEQYEDHYQLAIKWLQGIIHKLAIKEDNTVADTQYIQNDKAEAMFYLGIIYEHGFGTDKSPKKAFNYYIQSADLNYPAAKNKIGDCYFSGYGIKQDRQLAVGCYLEAAELGNSDAMVNLGTIYLNGIPGMVERNYSKAQQFFSNAIQLQNTDAMIHMSYIYRNGLGVDQNDEFAKNLLEQAAQNKNATALYMLKEQASEFNERVLFEHLQNQFFTAPKKLDLHEIVPIVSGMKSKK